MKQQRGFWMGLRALNRLIALFALCLPAPLAAQQPMWDSLRVEAAASTGRKQQELNLRLAEVYFYSAPDSAIRYARRALDWALLHHDRPLEARARETYGFAIGRSAQAMEQILEALRIYEETGDKAGVASAQNYLGNVFIALGQLDKSEEYFRKALQFYRTSGDTAMMARAYGNIGIIKRRMLEFDSSAHYLRTAIAYRQQLRDSIAAAEMSIYLARTLVSAGKADSARRTFEASLAVIRSFYGSLKFLSIGLNELARLELEQGHAARARNLADESLRLAERNSFLIEARDALRTLAEACEAEGDRNAALRYYKRHMVLRDSVLELDNRQQASKLQLEYETRQRDQQILLLQKQNQIESQTRRMWTLAAISALLVVLLLTIVYRLRARSLAEIGRRNEQLQQLVEEIRLQKEIAEDASRTRALLLDIAAHDLKNPLQSLTGLSELIREEAGPDTDIGRMAARMEKASHRMAGLIARFLDQNRDNAPALQADTAEVDLKQALTDLMDEARPQWIAKGQSLTADLAAVSLKTDRHAWTEIAGNLLSNAIKFTPAGREIHIRLREDDRMVTLDVEDSGPGLTPDDLAHLFERRRERSAQPTGGESSTGLGLAICRELAQMIGGTLSGSNRTSGGACFRLEIPRR